MSPVDVSRRGFTLIEVLVALAIVALGMATVMGALTSSADTVSYLRDKTFAEWVALNQVANVRLTGTQPPVGKSDGDTDFAGRKWHWHQEVVATQVPGVERIDVSARPADSGTNADDRSWLSTVSGISGDAVGAPNGFQPDWGTQTPAVPGNPGGTPNPSVTPNPVPTPTPPPRLPSTPTGNP